MICTTPVQPQHVIAAFQILRYAPLLPLKNNDNDQQKANGNPNLSCNRSITFTLTQLLTFSETSPEGGRGYLYILLPLYSGYDTRVAPLTTAVSYHY